MARLIYLLANAMGGATQVIDETGFHGLVDFELSLADPEATERGADGGSIFRPSINNWDLGWKPRSVRARCWWSIVSSSIQRGTDAIRRAFGGGSALVRQARRRE
jgi:hypothetical protein